MMEQLEFDAIADRRDALYELLSLEPETLDRLIMATGWGADGTRKVLLQLIAEGRVICRDDHHQPTFYVAGRLTRRLVSSSNHHWSN